MASNTTVPPRQTPKRVKLHLQYRDQFPWERICDGRNMYAPNINPGDLVVVCDACALKVVQDGQKEN